MDRFDRDLETEASHDSTRCLILRFIDADDLLESTVLEPVVHPRSSGLGGVAEAAEGFAEPPANLDGRQLHKPGNRDNAIDQLVAASGRRVRFITAVCVVDTATGAADTRSVETLVTFRPLDRALIERYVDREQPFDCAGSAKAEGLGIALIERIASTDPTALIGLPLIAVTDLLAACGVRIP